MHRVWSTAIALAIATGGAMAEPLILENGDIQLTLDVSAGETPRIAEAKRLDGGETVLFRETSDIPLPAWVPDNLANASAPCKGWQRVDHDLFLRAEASRQLARGLTITWRVDLAKSGSLIRLQTLLENTAEAEAPIEWFPVWNAAWQRGAQAGPVRYWDALTFVHHDRRLKNGETLTLASRIHSSDTEDDGKNPYWLVHGQEIDTYFGLEWCGGWQAELSGLDDGLGFRVFLPPMETQLTLKPGETIGGPVLNVVFAQGKSEATRRADWIRQRLALAENLYGGPSPSYPFTWNHWYSAD